MRRILLLAGLACLSGLAHAESYLFENVRIFNGVDDELTPGHVLVEDGVIATISRSPIDVPEGVNVIDGD